MAGKGEITEVWSSFDQENDIKNPHQIETIIAVNNITKISLIVFFGNNHLLSLFSINNIFYEIARYFVIFRSLFQTEHDIPGHKRKAKKTQ